MLYIAPPFCAALLESNTAPVITAVILSPIRETAPPFCAVFPLNVTAEPASLSTVNLAEPFSPVSTAIAPPLTFAVLDSKLPPRTVTLPPFILIAPPSFMARLSENLVFVKSAEPASTRTAPPSAEVLLFCRVEFVTLTAELALF